MQLTLNIAGLNCMGPLTHGFFSLNVQSALNSLQGFCLRGSMRTDCGLVRRGSETSGPQIPLKVCMALDLH